MTHHPPQSFDAEPAGALRGKPRFGWFAGSLALWSGATGMQQVLYSWLVLGELRASAEWVGTAQMFQSLPALLFLLVGGATADRYDRRRVLLVLHVAAAAAAGLMGLVVAGGALGMGVLLVYGLSWGTTQAFAQPARDAVISDVAGGDLMRAITTATLIQFGAAAFGSRGAGWAAHLGTPVGLALQAALLMLGFVLLLLLPPMPPHASASSRGGNASSGTWRAAATGCAPAPTARSCSTCEEYGTACLPYLRGEFAFTLWDERNGLLFAARDRFGIKPLYYAWHEGALYFASEIKALFAAGVPARWDREAFYQDLHIVTDEDRTLFHGIYQVPPGHFLLATRYQH